MYGVIRKPLSKPKIERLKMSETTESYYNKDADATSAHRKIVAFIRGHVSKMVPSFSF